MIINIIQMNWFIWLGLINIISGFKQYTTNQQKFIKSLEDSSKKLICVFGPAGTGKTHITCHHAMEKFRDKEINKIIITRPTISVEEEEIGFLPGTLNKKMDPWIQPLMDAFSEHYTNDQIYTLISTKKIEICPLGFMRGRTFKNSFIIADEMQNSTPNQMLMLSTRLGEGSTMVLTGDIQQKDTLGTSGLEDFIIKYKNFKKNKKQIDVIEFTKKDVKRSAIVSLIIDMYEP